jgi:hypothetical protein
MIDGFSKVVKIQINAISRIRNDYGQWDYNNNENIYDGFIVFTEVSSIKLEPISIIPNDLIEFVNVKQSDDFEDSFIFELEADCCGDDGNFTHGTITIISKGIHLEDPEKVGTIIVE